MALTDIAALNQQSCCATAGADDKNSILISNQLEKIEVTATKVLSPVRKFMAVSCTVKNATDSPIVVDGNNANLKFADAKINQSKTLKQLDAIDKPPTSGMPLYVSDLKSTVTAALTIGAVQALEGARDLKKPVLKRYKWDEERRTNEEERFGKRLLYPGDSTTGNLYFSQSNANTDQMELNCPIYSFYNNDDQANLTQRILKSSPL